MRVLTLLTDFGTRDYYVAALRGVALSRAPSCRLVDLTHDVDPGDVEAAAFLLSAASPWFPIDSVHCAVVDPGVGSQRRVLAMRRPTGLFVAPDNGLLTPLMGESEIRSVEADSAVFRPGPGATFHGRDRFVPIAAHLVSGGSFEGLGPRIEDPVTLAAAEPSQGASGLRGRVAHIDRFGNLVTDIPTAWLPAGRDVSIEVGDHSTREVASCYAEIVRGAAAGIPGSLGTLELSLNGASLAETWKVSRGESVEVVFR